MLHVMRKMVLLLMQMAMMVIFIVHILLLFDKEHARV